MVSPGDPLASLARVSSDGDTSAMRSLLVAVTPAVVNAVGSALGRWDAECDDVSQEALVALTGALGHFRFECTVMHFARRIALRTATTALRNRRAARRAPAETPAPLESGESVESPEGHPFEVERARRRSHLVRELIADLPSAQAEAIGLKVLLGYSVEEVAEATHTNVNTVRSRLQLAKGAMRERIASEDHFAELREEKDA
jgi:RNA polymerase sigma-70 factor (ECF subfamily)